MDVESSCYDGLILSLPLPLVCMFGGMLVSWVVVESERMRE